MCHLFIWVINIITCIKFNYPLKCLETDYFMIQHESYYLYRKAWKETASYITKKKKSTFTIGLKGFVIKYIRYKLKMKRTCPSLT